MTRIVWSHEANEDVARITDYYSTKAPDFILRLFDRLEAAVSLLRDRPLSGSPLGESGLRKLRIRRTPYLLLYQTRAGELAIVRIMHAARDWRLLL